MKVILREIAAAIGAIVFLALIFSASFAISEGQWDKANFCVTVGVFLYLVSDVRGKGVKL